MAKHRGRNEGSISQRSNGKYRAQVTLLDGKRDSKDFTTKKEASAWLVERRNEIGAGIISGNGVKTLADYAEGWLEWVEENRRPKTFIQYKDFWYRHINPVLGKRTLREIHPLEIERFLLRKKKEGLGERSRQLLYTILHVIFERAKKQRLIVHNPCDGVDRPEYEAPEVVPLSVDESGRLITEDTLTPYERAFYYLAVTTGMRRGELLGLMWDVVDFENGYLQVLRQVQWIQGQGTVICEYLKTKESKRVIHLPPHALRLLQEHRDSQQLEREAKKHRWKEHGLIFPSSVGTPKNPSNLHKRFKKLLDQAELENNRFHALRHTALSTAVNDLNGPIKVVEKIGGHSSKSQLTMKLYVHPPKEIDAYKTVAEGFDRLYGFDQDEQLETHGEQDQP